MVLWYYDKENRRQGPINPAQFKALVDRGVIVPDTFLETGEGKRAKASQIPGIVFPTNVVPPPLPPRIEPENRQPDNNDPVFPGPYPGDMPVNNPDHSQPPLGGLRSEGGDTFTPSMGGGVITEEPTNRPSADPRPAQALPTKKKGGFGGWLMDFNFTRLGILYHCRSFATIIYVLYVVAAFLLLFGLACQALVDAHGSWQELFSSLPYLGPFFVLVCLLLLFLLMVIRYCLEFGILLVRFLDTATQAAQKYLDSHHQEP